MRLTTFLFLAMILTLAACGGKDGGGSSSGTFSSALSTQNGYYNTQTKALEIGGQTYPPSQQYVTVMTQALNQAYASNIQPVNVNGVLKYRARITAQSINYNNTGYNTGSYNGGYNNSNPYINNPYNNQYGSSQLNITSVQFY